MHQIETNMIGWYQPISNTGISNRINIIRYHNEKEVMRWTAIDISQRVTTNDPNNQP